VREDPILKNRLKEILNEIITPRMVDIGLTKYDGRYLWFSDFDENGIKKVFHYNLMKGETGTFTYGNCFKFVPTYTQTAAIKNHKTDKSTTLHLFERTEGWRKSFEGGQFTDKTSHWGETECRRTVEELLEKYIPIMKIWWENNLTINQNIKTANYQIEKGGGYRVNHPSASYVKAFLIGKIGDKEKAIKIIEEEFVSLINYKPTFNELKNKIIERINEY
jgi:hypothetical protein